jgi:uncharacterized integral membrane protein
VLAKLGAFLKWLILIPVLAALALLGVANDHLVPVRLNPFEPDDPVLQVELALYMVVFLAFALGALVGALAMWNGQRRWRRRARREREEAATWQARAREARPSEGHAGLLAPPGRRA